MSSWYSNSLIILTLAAGALSPCVMPSSARAGDKIEFTIPGFSLETPKVVREVKEPTKADDLRSTRLDGPTPEYMAPDSSGFVFISTQKSKDAKTSYPTSTDDQDNDANAANADVNLAAKQQSINGAYRWDTLRGQDPYGGSLFSERRSAESVEDMSQDQDTLRSRLEAASRTGKIDYQRDERYNKRFPDATEDSGWSRSFFHDGLPDLNPMRHGQFVPLYEEQNVVSQQPNQGYFPARPLSAEDEQLRESMLPPGMAAYDAQLDAINGKIPDETAPTPHMFRPVDEQAVSQNTDTFARQEPPASPPGQVQSRPAILPYPKRPSSVLQ